VKYSTKKMSDRQLAGNRKILNMTGGRCYYCAFPLHLENPRDWMIIGVCRDFVREHKLPRQRGGENHHSNYVPSCWNCNGIKSTFTLDEFRFLRGLRCGDLSFTFPFEQPNTAGRDWLIVHSESFEKTLILKNFPLARSRYHSRDGFVSSHGRR